MRKEIHLDSVKDFVTNGLPFKVDFVEPVLEGVSTSVFRLRNGNDILYLRLSAEESFGPEVRVHEILLQRGVEIPRVEYFEDFNEKLGSSLMVVSEVKGMALDKVRDADEHLEVLKAAGRDLAAINSVSVEKFGWIKKGRGARELVAEFGTYYDYAQVELGDRLTKIVKAGFFDEEMVAKIRNMLTDPQNFTAINTPRLTHGDFAASHIYEDRGRYSGIIDLSDIKATSGFSDLAHLKIYNPGLFEGVLAGFREVTPLPKDFNRILTLELLIVALEKFSWVMDHTPREQIRNTEVVAIKEALKL